MCLAFAPVFKTHANTVLVDGIEEHPHHYLVERFEFSQIITRAMDGNERESLLQLCQDFRSILAQEEFARAALPVQMIYVVNVAGKTGLLKTNHMPVFVAVHDVFLATKPKQNSLFAP